MLRRILYVALLIVLLILLWEGLKAFAASNDYALHIGDATVDLTIFNNMQLPHLSDIVKAFAEPAQRNGPPLYLTLVENAWFTLQSAVGGFLIGGFFGFLLAVLFAHSRLMQGGCLPFVVASQTVPLIALAPMIVIWFSRAGNSALSIPVIAAYLTFFPVTIYTLRGLTSVPTTAMELMQSYAANQWEIFTKLRLPNALPQLFTALKISATASVVGAIIGELPSGFQNGLGVTILNFSRYYNQSPPRLWATIAAAGLVGILFFLVIVLIERLVVRWQREDSE
ncbi:MAG: ABC transporter permease subunit [Anaerolineae bacterium]|nr:ABC transporter permease subunit [Anaerolineae bacterium]